MAQAQFIGPTPAEINDQAISRFQQGFAKLQEFHQFTNEQNRLKKIETIKNKGDMLLKLANTYGDGDPDVGLKWLTQQNPKMVADYLGEVGYGEEQSKGIIQALATSDNTFKQFEQMLRDVMSMMNPGTGESSEARGSNATQVSNASQVKATQPSATAGTKPSGGELYDITLWDKGRKEGSLSSVYSGYDELQAKYKTIAQKLGIKPDNQGGREVWFTPEIAAQIQEKIGTQNIGQDNNQNPMIQGRSYNIPQAPVAAATVDTDENFAQFVYQYTNDPKNAEALKAANIKPVKTDPSTITNLDAKKKIVDTIVKGNSKTEGIFGTAYQTYLANQKGTSLVTGQTPAGAGEAALSPGELASDRGNLDQIFNSVNSYRVTQAQKDQAAGMPELQGLSPEQLVEAATHPNLTAANPVRIGGSRGTSSAPTQDSGPQAQGTTPAVGPLAESTTQTISSIEMSNKASTNKEYILAKRFGDKVKKDTTYAAFRLLAEEDPEGARAFKANIQASETNLSSLMRMVNPAGEVEFQRKKANGTLEAEKNKIIADAELAVANAKIAVALSTDENIKAQLDIRRTELEVEKEKLKIATMEANNAPKEIAARAKLAELQFRAIQLQNETIGNQEAYKPVADAYDLVIKSFTNLDAITLPKDKSGNIIADDTLLSVLNNAIDNANVAIRHLNAQGAMYSQGGTGRSSQSVIDELPRYTKANIADWWTTPGQPIRNLIAKIAGMKGKPVLQQTGGSTPDVAGSTSTSTSKPKRADTGTADDFTF